MELLYTPCSPYVFHGRLVYLVSRCATPPLASFWCCYMHSVMRLLPDRPRFSSAASDIFSLPSSDSVTRITRIGHPLNLGEVAMGHLLQNYTVGH